MVVIVLHIAKCKHLILIRLNEISFFLKDLLFHFTDYFLNQLTSCKAGSICLSIVFPNFLIFFSQDASTVLLLSLSTKLFFTSSFVFFSTCSVVANRVGGFPLARQRGRVGKAAQLTPPSAAAPFRPLTPEVVWSGGRNTAQDESCSAHLQPELPPLRQLSDTAPATSRQRGTELAQASFAQCSGQQQ